MWAGRLSPRRWGSSGHRKLWFTLGAGGVTERAGVCGPHLVSELPVWEPGGLKAGNKR